MSSDLINGDVPAHWEFTTLGEVCRRGGGSIQTGPFGSQLHASDYVPVGVPSIMPTNIGDNRIVEEGIVRVAEGDANRLSQHRVRPGDIIYSRRGDVGKRALIREREAGWLCGTGCLKVRLGDGIVDPLFASFFLGHPSIRQWIVRHAVGATMPNLNTTIMSAVPFALPPLIEQRAIAHILGTLDDKIELNRWMNQTLEAMARALFTSWFVDFDPVHAKAEGRQPPGMDAATAARFPSELQDSELGPIPKGWRAAEVRALCSKVENGGTPKRSIAEYWQPPSVPWLTSGEVRQPYVIKTENRISDEGLRRSSAKIWPAGTTIMAMYGATAGEVTLSAIDLCTNQACCGLLPLDGFRSFVYCTMRNARARIAGLARGSAQQNLSQGLIAGHKTVIPPPSLCQLFESHCAVWVDRAIANARETETLAEVRDSLLPRLLSGELSVSNAMKSVEAMG
jgi:type I restriction enzyme S subunit